MLDNLSAHIGPEVTEWLAKKRQARWHLHFVPTSSSWLNLVERWFSDLTERRLRRGVFTSVGSHGSRRDHREGAPWQGGPLPGQNRDG